VPGQGHPGGCTAVLLRRSRRILTLSAVPAGVSRPQTDREVGGSHLLQRDATLTSGPPEDGQQRRSVRQAGRGQICLVLGNDTRDFLFAVLFLFYAKSPSFVKTKTELKWHLTSTRAVLCARERFFQYEQKPMIHNVNCCLFHTHGAQSARRTHKTTPGGCAGGCTPAQSSPQSRQRSGLFGSAAAPDQHLTMPGSGRGRVASRQKRHPISDDRHEQRGSKPR
jgi:hypothetical protein